MPKATMKARSLRLQPARLTRLLAAAGLAASIAPALANDLTSLSLEDLLQVEVTTASKYKQDAREAPSQVQVITAEEIRQYGWRTLGEALNSLPGFYTSDDGVYQYLGARGFLSPGDYSTRFQMLLNGQRLNDNIYEQAQFGTPFPLDMALVERIEIISGPSSAIYGANALFGVINVIARDPAAMRGASGSAGYTTNGWRELRATTSARLGEDGPSLLASFSYADKGAQDISISAARGTAQLADGSVSADGVARGLAGGTLARAYVSLQQSGLQATAWATQRDVLPPLALYGAAFNDKRNAIRDASYGMAATLERQIDSDLQFTGRVAYQEQVFSGDFIYAGPPQSQTRVDTNGGWLSGESRFVYSGYAAHKLVFGANAQRDLRTSLRNIVADTGATLLDVNDKTWRTGVFVQDEWTIAPRWRLSTGARYDRYSIDLAHTSPRLGLVHAMSDSTTLKLLAGEAYRVPNAFERQYDDGYYLANPALKPEIIRTVEAILEQRIGNGNQLGLSLFSYSFRNQIDQTVTAANRLTYDNQPRTMVDGAEMYWRASRFGRGSLLASLGLNHAHSGSSAHLVNSPSWLAKLRAHHPLAEHWQGAIELDAIGPRDVASSSGTFRLGHQWWMNAVVNSSVLGRGTRLQLRVVNVFDRNVQIPVAEAAAPLMPLSRRTLQLMLSHDF